MERQERVSAWVTANRLDVATRVTTAFYARHPDWLARYGDAGRARGMEDALFHLDFLAGAVRAGSPTAFASYAGWVGQVLRARGLPPDALGEHLELLREELAGPLGAEDRAAVTACFDAAAARLAAGDTSPAGAEDDAAEVYLAAALRGDRRAALGVAREALARGWSPRRVYGGILAAAQRRVGALWAQNRLTVADEHIATATTQWVVAMLYGEL
ncbi:MAG: B12-binding domain-containing protein, partial [Myxococcota bacterium]